MDRARQYLIDRPAQAFFLMAFVWFTIAIVASSIREPFGFNYHIYKHFAVLANHGVDIFHDEASLPVDRPGITIKYLDFTPTSLALYRLIFFVSEHVASGFYGYYQSFLAFIGLYLAYRLFCLRAIEPFQWWCFFAVTLASPVWSLLPILEGEDKFIFFSAVFLAFVRVRFPGTAYIGFLGFFIALSGFPALFLPVAIIDTIEQWRRVRRLSVWTPLIICVVTAFLLSCLYFPDGAIMVANRSIREAQPPFWYSIWRIAPEFYSQYSRTILLAAFCVPAYLGYYREKLTFLQTVIFVEFVFLLLSNYTNFDRVNVVLVLPILANPSHAFLKPYTAACFISLHLMALFFALRIFNNQLDGWFVANMILVNGCLLFYVCAIISHLIPSRSPATA